MSDVFKEKDIDKSTYLPPDYKNRYEWFCSEYTLYDQEIPEYLKAEYNLLFQMFGKSLHDNDISKTLQKYKVNFDDVIPMPEIILSICDVQGQNKRMVMTRENISCITAQAKVGKSFLVKLIVSAILSKNIFQNRLLSDLPKGRDKILYIDTEQSKYHVKLGLSQIKELLTEHHASELDRINVFQFDAVSTLQRLEFVKWLIYNEKPDFVVIDGISDLALDTNNLKEADELVTNLRIWATENNCHICNVIHQNPNDHQTKMKGHLGTKLQDKSEIVIGVSIDKDNENNRIVQSLASRNRKPEPFQFTINENGMPEILEYEVSQNKISGKKSSKTEKPDHQLFQIITTVFSKKTGEIKYYTYGDLIEQIRLEYDKLFKESIGVSNAKTLITKFIDKNWIIKEGEKGNSRYNIGNYETIETTTNNSNDDMPFDTIDTTSETNNEILFIN